ncbi:MAG: response regulator [Chthoniobacterales bacterium]
MKVFVAMHALLPLKILIVENHPDTLRYIKEYLEQLGHEIHAAGEIQGALKILAAVPLDVLVSDIHLPDGDGWELMRQARKTHPRLFGIAMSGFGTPTDCEKSHAAGYHQHLVKPFPPEDLEAVLDEAAQSLSVDR